MATLWDKHRVAMLDKRQDNYRLRFQTGALLTPELDRHIIEWRDRGGKYFEPQDVVPRRVGFLGVSGEDGNFFLECAPVSWAQYVLMSKETIRISVPCSERFKVLSVCCLLVTCDGRFILAKRSKKVSTYSSVWHVSAAGYVDLLEAMKTQGVLLSVFRELEEELNLSKTNITSLRQLDLCQHLFADIAVVEACFFAKTHLSAAKVLGLAQEAKDSWEGKYSAFSEDEIRRLLHEDGFNPAGAATCLTHLNF